MFAPTTSNLWCNVRARNYFAISSGAKSVVSRRPSLFRASNSQEMNQTNYNSRNPRREQREYHLIVQFWNLKRLIKGMKASSEFAASDPVRVLSPDVLRIRIHQKSDKK